MIGARRSGDLFDPITRYLYSLVAKSDQKGLAKQLREWEAQTERFLKFEQYWQPTRLSFEEQQ